MPTRCSAAKRAVAAGSHAAPRGLQQRPTIRGGARYKSDSWLDQKECIVLDYAKTSLVAHWIRDEIRLISPAIYLCKVYWGKERLIDFCLKF